MTPDVRKKCLRVAAKAAIKDKRLPPLTVYMLMDLTEEMTELTENNIKSIGGTVRSWASYELEEYLAEAGIDTYHLSRSDMEPAIEAHLKGNQ